MLTMASTRTCHEILINIIKTLPYMTHLDGVLVGEEMNDFECMGDDADSEKLFAVVAPLHHQAEDIKVP